VVASDSDDSIVDDGDDSDCDSLWDQEAAERRHAEDSDSDVVHDSDTENEAISEQPSSLCSDKLALCSSSSCSSISSPNEALNQVLSSATAESCVELSADQLSASNASAPDVTSTPLVKSLKKSSFKGKPPKPKQATTPEWCASVDSSYASKIPQFIGQHKVNLGKDGVEPIDLFNHFFSDELLDMIVFQSNLYASQMDINNPLCLTRGELMIFLGINIIMTYIRYPRVRMYWSSSLGLRCGLFADTMSLNRFEQIRRFLHFADNTEKDTNNDKLKKIRPVLEKLKTAFKDAVDAEESHSVDEMMIPFTGKSSLKQYIRSKPKPWGYKVWVRSGVSGYVYDFEVYQGAGGDRPEKELGLCADVVMRLCGGLERKNHKVFFDNLFTTIDLLKALRDKNIYAIGTLRKNRLLGAEKVLKADKDLKERGSSSYATSLCDITVVKWNDNNYVHTASTFAGMEPAGTVMRWDKSRKEVAVPRPVAIEIYNKHMGGVDLTDFLVSCYRHTLKHKRWYMRIFFHFLNVSITNSWVISRWLDPKTKVDLLAFRSSIATVLISRGLSLNTRKRRGRPAAVCLQPMAKVMHVEKSVRTDPTLGHFPEKKDQKNASRCRLTGCIRRTRYSCAVCQVYICPECFAGYHA
jgi:hypothetical protein